MSIENPYATEEAWDVSTGTILGPGNHLCTLDNIEFEHSSRGNPTYKLHWTAKNGSGETTDWMTMTPNTVGKVVNFTDAVSLDRPGSDDVAIDQQSGYTIPTLAYMRKALNRQAGVVVRQETNQNDPTARPKDRVQGYVTADKVGGSSSDVPHQNPPSHNPSAPAPTSEDIPF